MSDKKLVNEAKSILEGIKTHQKTSGEKFSQFEKQLSDLKRAQRLIQEATAQKMSILMRLIMRSSRLLVKMVYVGKAKTKTCRSPDVVQYVSKKKAFWILISRSTNGMRICSKSTKSAHLLE